MRKILIILGVIAVVVVGWIGFTEWNTVYNPSDAYAVVPATPTKRATKDAQGKAVKDKNGNQEYSYKYSFDFVMTNGKHRRLVWEQSAVNPTPLTPGNYVYAEISQTRVTNGPNIVQRDKVPAKIRAELEQ